MRATGIIRRVDDLGRVVIPKEVRRILHIREGEPLEIFTESDAVIFRRYNPSTSVTEALKRLKDVVQDNDDLKCQADILKSIREMENYLKLEQERFEKGEVE